MMMIWVKSLPYKKNLVYMVNTYGLTNSDAHACHFLLRCVVFGEPLSWVKCCYVGAWN